MVEGFEVVADATQSLPPFTGGWVGYFGYDIVRLVERLPNRPPDRFGLPLAILARFDAILAFDHARQRVLAIANEIDGEVDADGRRARLDQLGEWITRDGDARARTLRSVPPTIASLPPRASIRRPTAARCGPPRSTSPPATSSRWCWRAAGRSPRRPRRSSSIARCAWSTRAPTWCCWNSPTWRWSAPRRRCWCEYRRHGSRPGRSPAPGPAGASPEDDARLAAELLADAKERAEHVMLVDLGRNDLGRVARPGSVAVGEFMKVERYSHVMHIVSSVSGRLRADRTALDALLACFPAGTVSGAPKIRAMEIIDALEPEARGPYAGAVGYLSFSGDLDTCITIRTLVVTAEGVSVTAGAGIVADSDPATEERETENKAAAMLQAVALAEELFS